MTRFYVFSAADGKIRKIEFRLYKNRDQITKKNYLTYSNKILMRLSEVSVAWENLFQSGVSASASASALRNCSSADSCKERGTLERSTDFLN